MNVFMNLLVGIQMLAALAMIGLILIQHGKGADMGAAFGSGSAGSLFGASGSANFLSRTTAVLAAVFFGCTLALAYLISALNVTFRDLQHVVSNLLLMWFFITPIIYPVSTIPEQFRSGWVDEVNGLPLVKFRLYVNDKGTDIDVFLAETQFQEQVMRRRVCAEVEDRTVWVVTPEDLLLLKLIANRPRDYIDIADVRFMEGQLDEAYMRTWAEKVNVLDRLEKVLQEPAF